MPEIRSEDDRLEYCRAAARARANRLYARRRAEREAQKAVAAPVVQQADVTANDKPLPATRPKSKRRSAEEQSKPDKM